VAIPNSVDFSHFPSLHRKLLAWYDKNHRHLPWRAAPGQRPNPYHVLLSEVMLQQTTVPTVIDYFNRFIARWPTLQDLAQANQEDLYHQWQGLGYYSRARNLHACVSTLVQGHQGMPPQSSGLVGYRIPSHPDDLIKLPGVGPYTAASISAIAYDYPIVPVDGNVVRVVARFLALETPLPALKKDIQEIVAPLKPSRSGDFAQSLMDLGATICKPKNPACDRCPLQTDCQSFEKNRQHLIPFMSPKPLKPTRYTYAFWYQDDGGFVCLTRRPETGILANMVGLPTCDWVDDESLLPPLNPRWIPLPTMIKHTFTHFHLKVACFIVKDLKGLKEASSVSLFKVKPENFKDYPIPTLMKKIIRGCILN
jgi:A/G-specific adenine glycosylase